MECPTGYTHNTRFAEEILMRLTEAINIPLNENIQIVDQQGPLMLSDGSEPDVLFRVADKNEWEEAQRSGFLTPSKFYGRIHASIKPERQYGMRDSIILAIKYRRVDGWYAKSNLGGDVYAVTDKRIPVSIIRDITRGI